LHILSTINADRFLLSFTNSQTHGRIYVHISTFLIVTYLGLLYCRLQFVFRSVGRSESSEKYGKHILIFRDYIFTNSFRDFSTVILNIINSHGNLETVQTPPSSLQSYPFLTAISRISPPPLEIPPPPQSADSKPHLLAGVE
jgi:hypothetical protein